MIINKNILIDLTILYNGPNRHYHNLDHIHHCLGDLEEYMQHEQVLMKRELEYAIWFHDAIYNVHSKENEKNSALLFKQYAKEIDLSLNEDLVIDLILGTAKHEIINQYYAEEHKLMNDIDFCILGEDKPTYGIYSSAIRKEYSHISQRDFTEARIAFLESLLNSEKIYNTSYFNKHKEQVARGNIKLELSSLGYSSPTSTPTTLSLK